MPDKISYGLRHVIGHSLLFKFSSSSIWSEKKFWHEFAIHTDQIRVSMGAGASVEAGRGAANAAEDAQNGEMVQNAAKVGENAARAAEAGAADAVMAVGGEEAAGEVGQVSLVSVEAAGAEVEAYLASIEDDQVAMQAGAMISKASEVMTVDEVRDAVIVMKQGVALGAQSSVILVSIGGALNEAAGMAPAVLDCVTVSLIQIGPHLPLIGIAAGALGALAAAYVKAKEDDEVVKTFGTWCGGVKDWLILVAGRVDRSGGENTVKVFEELKDKLLELKGQLDTQSKRGFVTKMLTTTTFNRHFQSCKTMVSDLKMALKDYLDQEAQDKQEAMLTDIQASNLRVEEKVGAMSDDISQIKEMLAAQIKANEKSDMEKAMEASEEERLYAMMQSNVMLSENEAITFKQLVMNVQTLLFKNQKLPAEMQRGLKISADEQNTGKVTKLQFIGFYRSWQESGLAVDEFLLSVADANPTMFDSAMASADRASQLMGAGALSLSAKYAKYGDMAGEAANIAAEIAADAASGMIESAAGLMKSPSLSNLGGMFGGGSSGADIVSEAAEMAEATVEAVVQ